MKTFPRNANVASVGPALLFVKADWCGYCREATPVLKKVSSILGSVVPVYAIDVDQRPDLARALGAKSFPTIIYARADNTLVKYEGERTADAISSFVCQNSTTAYPFCARRR